MKKASVLFLSTLALAALAAPAQSFAAESIELNVPGSTTKYAEKYSTQLNWTLTDVPGNE